MESKVEELAKKLYYESSYGTCGWTWDGLETVSPVYPVLEEFREKAKQLIQTKTSESE